MRPAATFPNGLRERMAWSLRAWEGPGLAVLLLGWPQVRWRYASSEEDMHEATDLHVAFRPGERERRVQWRALRWAGYATFTRKDSRERASPTEAMKLARGAPVALWLQAYFWPREGRAERCVAMGLARTRTLVGLWDAERWVQRNTGEGAGYNGTFSAIEFARVVPRWEWRPHTAWLPYK